MFKIKLSCKILKIMGQMINERKRSLSNEADACFQTHDKRKTLYEKYIRKKNACKRCTPDKRFFFFKRTLHDARTHDKRNTHGRKTVF